MLAQCELSQCVCCGVLLCAVIAVVCGCGVAGTRVCLVLGVCCWCAQSLRVVWAACVLVWPLSEAGVVPRGVGVGSMGGLLLLGVPPGGRGALAPPSARGCVGGGLGRGYGLLMLVPHGLPPLRELQRKWAHWTLSGTCPPPWSIGRM